MDKQFDDIYTLSPDFSENPAAVKKRKFIENEQIMAQEELLQRPSNIGWFEQRMYETDPAKGDRPRIGYFCNMIPWEVISALGAEPVRLDCGNGAAAIVGEEVLSGEICPLAKASFGSFLQEESLAGTCDALVLPTSCDAKRKMGEALNDFTPTFMFNLPPEQNHSRYAKSCLQEMVRLIEFLEARTGTRLSTRRLRESIALGRRRTLLTREFFQQRIENPGALSVRDLFLMIQVSFFRPIDLSEWMAEMTKALEEVKSRARESGSFRSRIVLTGAPMVWPNFKALNVLEESGADIVADTLCTGVQSCFDPVVSDERGRRSLLRALVNRSVFAAICPCFISQTTRINRILDLVDECRADGVVNYSLRLCQLFDVENYRISRILKSRGVPFLNLRTDYSLEDTEQLRIRIEAFLETI